MESLVPVALTDTGKPKLAPGELELCVSAETSLGPVDKHAPPSAVRFPPGFVYVTTHRLLWVAVARDYAGGRTLRDVPPPTDTSRRVGSPRLELAVGSGVRLEFHARGSAAREARARVVSAMTEAARRRAWDAPPPPDPVAANPFQRILEEGGGSRDSGGGGRKTGGRGDGGGPQLPQGTRVGVGGLMRARRQVADESGMEIGAGFSSLKALQDRADALVCIANRFRSLKVNPDGDEAHNKLLKIMGDMCIDSPVTRETTGNDAKLYQMELARELSEHLRIPVTAVGGIMTIADAYCLINRVRATNEYVPPDDFAAALGHFVAIRSRLTVFRLDSGVRAIKVDMAREPGGIEAIAAMACEDGRASISALEVMQKRSIPVQTALDLLKTAELAGLLARDETTAGLRFFPNSFPAFCATRAAVQR